MEEDLGRATLRTPEAGNPAQGAYAVGAGRVAPVRRIPTDPEGDAPSEEIALCLSGGGYRAMLFHVGALWRLNDLGLLAKMDRISSVSGGSITAAVLALAWGRLGYGAGTVIAGNFEEVVARPVRTLASHTIDIGAILKGLLPFSGGASARVAAAYRRHLFGRHGLLDFPDRPRFILNATNLQSGVLWRFSKSYIADYRVGWIDRPKLAVATAVAASSAFPPVLSPLVLRFRPGEIRDQEGADLHRPPFTRRAVLTDGGVYDNLGLETAWKRCRTLLVSDGGGRMGSQERPWRDWILQMVRATSVIDNQVRDLRKRQLIEGFRLPLGVAGARRGAYWGLWTPLAEFPAGSPFACPEAATRELAGLPTRLAA